MKKFLFIFSISLGISVLLALPAEAQKKSSKKRSRKVRVGKTVYDFDEVDILGKLRSPEGQSIVAAPELRFQRLLDLDESFISNIIRAADEF